MARKFEIIEQQLCYQGFFRLERYRLRHELFAGGMSRVLTRELLERGHAVAVLPYDPALDAVVLIEQFRVGALQEPEGPWLLEIPAGMIEEGERAEGVAHREVREEAGCDMQELLPICEYLVSPGGTSERISLFCGRIDSRSLGGVQGLHDEGEDILVHVLPVAEALELMTSGRIRTASPIIALQWLASHHGELRARWRA
ncbi:MAG: NUDIX domain-containing protein [Gammaproteobacteria bacterium]